MEAYLTVKEIKVQNYGAVWGADKILSDVSVAVSRAPVPLTIGVAKHSLGQARRNGRAFLWPTYGCSEGLKPVCTESPKHSSLLLDDYNLKLLYQD